MFQSSDVPKYNYASFLTDPRFVARRKAAALELREVRFFLDDPETPIHRQTRNYMNWLRHLQVGKVFTKWIAPMWTTETTRAMAVEVFGKEEAPLPELGVRTLTSYIRYLLFTKGWSQDGVTKHLVDDLTYPYNRARPMIRRVMREEAHQRELHKSSGEATMFEGVLVPAHH